MKKWNRILIAGFAAAVLTAANFSAYAAPGGMEKGGGPGAMSELSGQTAPEKPSGGNETARKSDEEAMAEGTIPQDLPQNEGNGGPGAMQGGPQAAGSDSESMQNGQMQMPQGQQPPADGQGMAPDGQGMMPDGQMPGGPGFDNHAVQEAVDALEDDSVRSSVQEKLDAYQSALDAEKEYLDSLDGSEETDSTYSDAVQAAREALEEALKEADVDVEALFPAAEGPDGNMPFGGEGGDMGPNGQGMPGGSMKPDGTHEPDGTHAPDGTQTATDSTEA